MEQELQTFTRVLQDESLKQRLERICQSSASPYEALNQIEATVLQPLSVADRQVCVRELLLEPAFSKQLCIILQSLYEIYQSVTSATVERDLQTVQTTIFSKLSRIMRSLVRERFIARYDWHMSQETKSFDYSTPTAALDNYRKSIVFLKEQRATVVTRFKKKQSCLTRAEDRESILWPPDILKIIDEAHLASQMERRDFESHDKARGVFIIAYYSSGEVSSFAEPAKSSVSQTFAYLWDIKNDCWHKLLAEDFGYSDVRATFSHNDRLLAMSSSRNRVLYDISNGKPQILTEMKPWFNWERSDCIFSHNDQLLVFADHENHNLLIIDTKTGLTREKISHPTAGDRDFYILKIRFSHDDRFIAICSNSYFWLYDRKKKQSYTYGKNNLNILASGCAFFKDDTTVLCNDNKSQLLSCIDTESGALIKSIPYTGQLESLKVSHNDLTIAAIQDPNTLVTYRKNSFEEMFVQQAHVNDKKHHDRIHHPTFCK